MEHFEVLVIGGGQAGLATGFHLAERGIHSVILDDGAQVGDPWRRRWDSLRLFTPARLNGLPGVRFPAPPSAIVTKDQVADYMASYAKRFALPVRLGTRVVTLAREDGAFVATLGDGSRVSADQVVVATGSYGVPRRPSFAGDLDPAIVQLHSTEYRRPAQLRVGDVLIVGAGNSGAEIAMDAAATHRTWLSGRDTGSVPYPLMFSPPVWWAFKRVLSLSTPIGRRMASGGLAHGQPVVRLRPKQLAAAGIQRVPRVAGIEGGRPRLEDGRVLDVGTVVWCTGFDHTFPWITTSVPRADGDIPHQRGVADSEPGLYFVGRPFQQRISSSLIAGVGEDAKYVVDRIAARARRDPR